MENVAQICHYKFLAKKHVGVGRLICTLKQLYFLAFKTVTNQIFSSAANLS